MSRTLVDVLEHLHVDRSHGKPAPHKPILLLAILDLIEDGVITENRVEYNPRLVERFNEYWNALAPRGHQPRSWLPFFHLRHDGFWKLMPQANATMELAHLQSPKSVSQLRDFVCHAALGDEAWNAFRSEDDQKRIRKLLVETYFNADEQARLRATIRDERTITRYAEGLLEMARRKPFVLRKKETALSASFRRVRDRAFRRLIRDLYADTCCMCELRLVTFAGHSVFVNALFLKGRLGNPVSEAGVATVVGNFGRATLKQFVRHGEPWLQSVTAVPHT